MGYSKDQINEAAHEGYEAGIKGGLYSHNPYRKYSDLYYAWAAGWEQGHNILIKAI